MKKLIIGIIILSALTLGACDLFDGALVFENEPNIQNIQKTEAENPDQQNIEDKEDIKEAEGAQIPQQTEAPEDEIIQDSGRGDDFSVILIGEKYYCSADLDRSITFNRDGTFTFADGYGSSAGDYIIEEEVIYIRFYVGDAGEADSGMDSYFTIIDMKNLEEMHGEIYTVEPSASGSANSGGTVTSGVTWQEGSIYINSEKGVAIEISQVGASEFWVDIVQLADVRDIDNLYGLNSLSEISETQNAGYYVFWYGWAQIDADNVYFAMYESYGFSLHEDFDAMDIFAGESTEWAHLRGQYNRIR